MLLAICGASAVAHATEGGRTVFVPRAVIYPGDVITTEALIERKLLVAPKQSAGFWRTFGRAAGQGRSPHVAAG